MGLVQQFLKSFIQEDDLVPGLFEKPDGSVWVRLVDGGESAVSGGGSQPEVLGPFPFAWNTPNLLTGHLLGYTPPAGALVAVAFDITTFWDGSSPFVWVFDAGGDPVNLGSLSGPVALNNTGQILAGFQSLIQTFWGSAQWVAPGGVGLSVQVSKMDGTDPVNTDGAGSVYLLAQAPSLP